MKTEWHLAKFYIAYMALYISSEVLIVSGETTVASIETLDREKPCFFWWSYKPRGSFHVLNGKPCF